MSDVGELTREDGLALLEGMWLIRAFEEKASELYARGLIRGLLHLSVGQEAVAVGACSVLSTADVVVSGHRPHGHLLAKGGDPEALFAELAGRATGYCRGKGGSMHVAAPNIGFLTATGVVAGNIPLALGAALAAGIRGDGTIACAFFGDGAGQTGAFHESLNLAALWRLPVVFVCENNGYAEFSPLSEHTVVERLSAYAQTYRIPSFVVDGNDVLEVRDAMRAAADRARGGDGPAFVEALTYRMRGHYEGDQAAYRAQSELQAWQDKDPIGRFAKRLHEAGLLDDADRGEVEERAHRRVGSAADAALAAPHPHLDEAALGVYA